MEKENLKNFIKNNFYHVSSLFFLEKFINMIQSVSKTTYNDTALFEFEIIFDEKASNFLNIVHGGGIAIICENLSNICLYELNKSKYQSLEISITYKYQAKMYQKYNLKIKIEKYKYKTVYITCSLIHKENNKEVATVNIIKSLMPTSKY